MALFNAWKKQDRDDALIRAQAIFIGLMFLLCILFCMGWMMAPSRLRIYIPPDISNGAILKAGEIPDPWIYSFAYEIWQELNYWSHDGSQDYSKNLRVFSAYITPEFQTQLKQDYSDLLAAGQIQRQRFIQGIAYEASSVKKINHHTWKVDLKVRLMEYKNGQLVKDTEILYPLRIIRHEVSNSLNPYGLAIAGFVTPPKRLKNHV